MASPGKGAPVGLFARLREAFRQKFVISANYEPYMPPTPKSTAEGHSEFAYRYPAPGSQPPAEIPTSYPETVYDIASFKRSSITLAPPRGADPEIFRKFAQPGMYEGDYPRHSPKPWWFYDEGAMKAKRELYLRTGGVVTAGWSRQKKEEETVKVWVKP